MAEPIVSMIQFNGKVLVATKDHVFDITDGKREVLFSSEAASQTVMGKKYTLVEHKED